MSEDEPSQDPRPAPRLGSYRLIRQLGSGGMSNVFEAIHEESGSVVAVKVLPRTLAKNVVLLQRFLREAKSAEALDHPNIAAIYDRGFDQGRHYLVLEYVEGRDLHDRVRMNGPLPADEAVRFIREVAEGLRYAVGRGMIHRDVKPANLLMTPDGHPKIIDLGLALQTEDEDERVTRDGTTVGTVDYMAPEQARDSRQTSERSDIYSLGCTFYYLLTGSAPYPGGGLADKLSRHYKAPIPDVRTVRPEISEALSLLIRRMMEKKPDLRFADYDALIAAIDTLNEPARASIRSMAPLDVLIDDEEGDEIGLATDAPLMAEFADDDEDDEPSPGLTVPIRNQPDRTAEVSLADLAALDADIPASARSGRRPSPSASARPRSSAALDAMLEKDDDPVEGGGGGVRRSGAPELPLRTWIAAGALVGLAIAVVGFGVSVVISMSKSTSPVAVNRPDREPELEPEPIPSGPRPVPRPVPIRPAPIRPVPLTPATTPIVTPIQRPVVAEASPATEPRYPKDWTDRLGPPPNPDDPESASRPRVIVRRWLEAGDESQVASIAAAFGRSGETVEFADTGPFFEDNCQVSGKSRLIRARPGIRPILMIDSTTQEVVKAQEAKFVLDGSRGERLVLEGIDLAVDLRDLPDHQTSLFVCRGSDLTLRDCSITIVNVGDRRTSRFSVFRVEEGVRPTRVVLERTTVRGPIRTLVDLTAPRAEIVLDRSVIVGESGPLIAVEPTEKGTRTLIIHRSLLASRGPVLDLPVRGAPLSVKTLGSTFARIEGGPPSGMILSRSIATVAVGAILEWSGEANHYQGWPTWMSVGPDNAARVTGLEGVRTAWPGSEGSSLEAPGPWPAFLARDGVVPDDFASYDPRLKATLAQVAKPHPRLGELTFAAIPRLAVPELSTTLIPPFVEPAPSTTASPGPSASASMPMPVPVAPRATTKFVPNPNGPVRKGPLPVAPGVPGVTQGPVVPPVQLDLTFDVLASPWAGDLGRFMTEKVAAGTLRATIRVKGSGTFACSPIRLPDGVSVGILGEPTEESKLPWTTFVPHPSSASRTLIEIHGGDLALANLAFESDGTTRVKHWIRTEGSLLGIRHCRFRDSGPASAEGGSVIAFEAAGTDPIHPRVGPFLTATDRPVAMLKNTMIWTGGEAISADVARGVVDLENCLLLSGGPAITLRPLGAAPSRFEADLVLDHCTIADDRTGIVFGPWPGEGSGPDRPWLISTRLCVFPRTQVGGAGALLLVDPLAMARGALFWQSSFDALDVGRFLASTASTPPNPPPADLKKGWVDLWGSRHARGVRGPDPRRSEQVLRYKERPRPGKVSPGGLELDSRAHKDLGVDLAKLPPSPRG